MLSGLTSYLFGGSTEEGHPAVTTKSAVNLATEAAMKNSPKLRTSSTDEGWEIVDKSSRGNSPHRLEEDPMENLLIEHPSMSVYQHRGGRPNSRGSSDEDEEEDEEAVVMDTSSPRQVADTRHGSRSARLSPSSSSLQAALAAKSKHGAQAAKKRKDAKQMARKQLDRTNKLTQYNSSCKSARRKHHLTRCNAGRTNDRKCQY